MIKIEHKKNGEVDVKISGNVATVWCELLEGVRRFHNANSEVLGESAADTITDSLAFLGKLTDEEITENEEELLDKFFEDRNNNN